MSEELETLRPAAFAIAYRMLGSVSEAEARAKRETYVGDWLPEPLVASAEDDPARRAEMADSLSLAFLVLLESLSPEQRAAFLLHEVFDEPYSRIADVIGTRSCWPTTWSSAATAGARRRASSARSTAAPGWRAR